MIKIYILVLIVIIFYIYLNSVQKKEHFYSSFFDNIERAKDRSKQGCHVVRIQKGDDKDVSTDFIMKNDFLYFHESKHI